MTPRIGSAVTAKLLDRMRGPSGVNSGLAALSSADSMASPLEESQVSDQNVAAELAERSGTARYPAIQVYCEKVANTLSEKFRKFSGRVRVAIEVRHSQDRLEGLQDRLELYTEAVTQVLHGNRGDWGDGVFYAGDYEISFGGVKHGGKNFMQIAKITFETEVSRS